MVSAEGNSATRGETATAKKDCPPADRPALQRIAAAGGGPAAGVIPAADTRPGKSTVVESDRCNDNESQRNNLTRSDFAERVRHNQKSLGANLSSQYDFIVCGSGPRGSLVVPLFFAKPPRTG